MTPKVSVVMIFLNAERFIRDSIASVAAQSMPDWELLLVDDGSTDLSSDYALDAAAHDPRIRYVEHPGHVNKGLAATRNLGLHEARGQYILYLDSDDILFPEALARMAARLDADAGIGLTCSATLFWNWDSAIEHEPDKMQFYREWADRTVDGRAFLAAMIADEDLHPANCGTMARRQAMLDAGGFTLAVPGIYEDTALMTALLMRYRVHVASTCLSAYRMHMASHCHTAVSEGDYTAGEVNPARARYLDWAESYLGEAGALTGELARAIAAARQPEGQRYGLAARLGRMIRHPEKLVARVRPRRASVDSALTELQQFHHERGELTEVDRLSTRRGISR